MMRGLERSTSGARVEWGGGQSKREACRRVLRRHPIDWMCARFWGVFYMFLGFPRIFSICQTFQFRAGRRLAADNQSKGRGEQVDSRAEGANERMLVWTARQRGRRQGGGTDDTSVAGVTGHQSMKTAKPCPSPPFSGVICRLPRSSHMSPRSAESTQRN